MKSIRKININKYSLLDDAFSKKDIAEGVNVILSKRITMSKITSNFEKKFAKSIGSKYAVMGKFRIICKFIGSICRLQPFKEK